jgi:hypothetical protein
MQGRGRKMKIATMKQHENGMYMAEIRDNDNVVESAITCLTAFEVHKWAYDNNCDDLILNSLTPERKV